MLDLGCGAGGASVGYWQTGRYEITGVDMRPQPRYPFRFVQGDMTTFPLDGFDIVHASPPCPRYSRSTKTATRDRHPDLLPVMRQRLTDWGGPFIIENVPGAPMRADIKLCACLFDLPKVDGAQLSRERWFETNPFLFYLRPPCYHSGPSISVTCKCGRWNGSGPRLNKYVSLDDCKTIMGVWWMNQNELGNAVPPPYTRLVGDLMARALDSELEAAV